MTLPTRRPPLPSEADAGADNATSPEWLATNGLGGYASSTLNGIPQRRYHGLLVASLPNPLGRTVMLSELAEALRLPDGTSVALSGDWGQGGSSDPPPAGHLEDFHLEGGLPVWRYRVGDIVLEKRTWMVHAGNTTMVQYRLLAGDDGVLLQLRPALNFRGLEDPVSSSLLEPYSVHAVAQRLELQADAMPDMPPLRLQVSGAEHGFTIQPQVTRRTYPSETQRGYDDEGDLWIPGHFRVSIEPGSAATLVASTESWATIDALTPEQALAAEQERREHILARAPAAARTGIEAELTLAADAFVVTPAYRSEDVAARHAAGDELRSVIAGYHWFTDWGRDTMIALEGLALCTGMHQEAGQILRTFAHYTRDGLIPNMFPHGSSEGLYHTADASLWFFHAVDRYTAVTDDQATLQELLPVLRSIADAHLEGTRFGIRVDPEDGLLTQGEEGYQLTWMDAKVDDWVVTPRRGKAVELNALWYNALRLLQQWCADAGAGDGAGDGAAADEYGRHADRARSSFNDRFWLEDAGHLCDIVDGPDGDDPALRPNQVFAISLPHAILDQERWEPVLTACREELLTPVGMRSLAPGHPDYRPNYHGNLRERDGAYHQGTVWPWLIGPFVDAWLRAYPEDTATARSFLDGLVEHLDEFGVGSVAEIFDAEHPFTPRGCIAQAWSVSELLRCRLRTD